MIDPFINDCVNGCEAERIASVRCTKHISCIKFVGNSRRSVGRRLDDHKYFATRSCRRKSNKIRYSKTFIEIIGDDPCTRLGTRAKTTVR